MARAVDLSAFDKVRSLADYDKAAIEEARQRFMQDQALQMQQKAADRQQQMFDLERQKFEAEKAQPDQMFGGNSFQAQLGNQMKRMGYSDDQIIQALTMKGIPLQDGGYATYSPSNVIGAPAGQRIPSGTPAPSNPAPVQTEELPPASGEFGNILDNIRNVPPQSAIPVEGNMNASNDSLPLPTPENFRPRGPNVIVQPGMKQADAMAAMSSADKAEAQAVNSIALIDKLIDENGNIRPEAASVVGPIQGRTVANIPMTRNQTYAQPIIDQIRGQAFLQAFESLKGGGAITEIEGQKATQAMARLSQTQYEPDFANALKELRDIMAVGMQRARQMRGQIRTANPVQNQMDAAPQDVRSSTRRRYNPATGELE